MQLDMITSDLNNLEFVVFDHEALIVYQSGGMEKESLVIDLTDLVSNAVRLELFEPDSCTMVLHGRHILLRKIGEFCVALVAPSDPVQQSSLELEMIKLYYRLSSELLA